MMNNRINWIKLSALGRSKFINSFSIWLVIVPILTRLLDELPKTLSIQCGDIFVVIVLSLPFHVSVFYFAAVSFTISSIIYKVFCPPLIRVYDDACDFMNKSGSYFQIESSTSMLDSVQAKEINEKYAGLEMQDENNIKQMYNEVTHKLRLKNKKSGFFCSLGYMLGFVLILIVFIENSFSVMGVQLWPKE